MLVDDFLAAPAGQVCVDQDPLDRHGREALVPLVNRNSVAEAFAEGGGEYPDSRYPRPRGAGELEGQADDDLDDLTVADQGDERVDVRTSSAPNQGFEGMADHAQLVGDRYSDGLHADIESHDTHLQTITPLA